MTYGCENPYTYKHIETNQNVEQQRQFAKSTRKVQILVR